MHSPKTLEGINRAAANRAAAERHVPMALFSEESAADDCYAAPMLGDYLPYGWRVAFHGDYAEALNGGNEATVSQRACAARFRGDLILWCANGYPMAERGEYDRRSIARDAPRLYRRAVERGVVLGVAIVEAGPFQVYLRFYEKPYDRR